MESRINIKQWIEENKSDFKPPVGNKMMYNEQLIIMFVGGPNVRDDYHINEGEEFFYMVKGDMCLKIVEKGVFKDIHIKEGEIFLLPGRTPHSPQRQVDTVGLVIERKRASTEMDVLRYYIEPGKSTEVLYEKSFHSLNLGKELPPIINAYFASEEYKTRKPTESSVLDQLPFELNDVAVGKVTKLIDHFVSNGHNHANVNNEQRFSENSVHLFPGQNQFDIRLHSKGVHTFVTGNLDTWIWAVQGSSNITVKGQEKKNFLDPHDSILIRPNSSVTLDCESDDAKVIEFSQPTKND